MDEWEELPYRYLYKFAQYKSPMLLAEHLMKTRSQFFLAIISRGNLSFTAAGMSNLALIVWKLEQ